jgi:soluble lytic murein transglycosylase
MKFEFTAECAETRRGRGGRHKLLFSATSARLRALRGNCFSAHPFIRAIALKARPRAAAIAVALLCLASTGARAAFTAGEVAATRTAIADIDHGNWDGAHQAAGNAHFALLEKLVTWFDLTRPGTTADFATIAAFVDKNPDWPSQMLLRRHAEDAIADSTPPAQIIAWFQRYAPQGPTGAGRYVDALATSGQRAAAEATARQFLIEGTMTGAQMTEFAGRYRPMLRQVDFQLRADRLIWAGDIEGATQVLPDLSPGDRAVAQARIAFASQSPSATSSLAGLSDSQQNDLGLLYERMRWLRRQNRDSEAIALLAIAPPTLPHAELWWNERAVLARRALENHDPKAAYELARDHRQASGAALADGEWLSGWIALRFLNQPKAALQHFKLMQSTVATPVSIARAAYWAARAEEALGDQDAANRDYAKAATHIGAFYGQLALAKLTPSAKLALPPEPRVAGLDARSFSNSELVQVTQLFAAIGLPDRGDAFVRRMGDLARTPEDALLAMRLAKANNSLAAEVHVAKKLMQGGMEVLADGYPVIAHLGPKEPEPELVHAIIRQESQFDASAVSPSGALGLMQLMPGTARGVASKMRIKAFKIGTLTADPRSNVVIGASYLADLVDHFGGSYVMAIAGYNAGPGRVAGWLSDNGDPRPKLDDMIDWIEKIGVYETRNYVQRVVENLEIYRARMAGGAAPNAIVKDLVR